jgi:KRAB domain-containing zinc finger protein
MMEESENGSQEVKRSMSLAIEGLIEACKTCLKTFLVMEFDNSVEKCQAISDVVVNIKHITETVKNIFEQIQLFTDTTVDKQESLLIKHYEEVKEEPIEQEANGGNLSTKNGVDVDKIEKCSLSGSLSSQCDQIFPCTECEEVFPTSRGLNKHLKQIHSIARFQCKDCGKGFAENYLLVKHAFRAHSGERPFPCDYDSCEKSFKSGFELKKHRFTHSGERLYECAMCPKTFRRAGNFNTHKRMHEDRIKDEKTVVSKIECEENVDQIVQSLSGELDFGETVNETREIKPPPTNSEYLCSLCGTIFDQRKTLKQHTRSVHSSRKPGPRYDKNQREVCNICGKLVAAMNHSTHLAQHRGIDERCPYCGRAGFSLKTHLRAHIRRVHEKQKNYFCDQCEYAAFKSDKLRAHIKNVHENHHHVCPDCGKQVKHMFHHLKHAHKHQPQLYEQYSTKTGIFSKS